MEKGRLHSLQVVRFAAASLVILFHASAKALDAAMPHWLVILGPLGVDLFFVLSGYIIATTAPGMTVGGFVVRRLTRIMPLYYLMTAAMIALLAIGGHFSPQFLPTNLTLIPISGGFHYVNSAWTLEYEMLFYAGATLVLAFRRPALAWLMLAFAVATIGRSAVGGGAFDYLGNPLIFEFLIGAVMAQLKLSPRLGGWALGAGAALLLPMLALRSAPEGWFRILIDGAPCGLIVLGASAFRGSGPIARWLAGLGDASYAAYLVHQFPVMFLHLARSPTHAAALIALAFAIAWMLGVLIYTGVELPLLKALRSGLQFRKPVLAAE